MPKSLDYVISLSFSSQVIYLSKVPLQEREIGVNTFPQFIQMPQPLHYYLFFLHALTKTLIKNNLYMTKKSFWHFLTENSSIEKCNIFPASPHPMTSLNILLLIFSRLGISVLLFEIFCCELLCMVEGINVKNRLHD